MASFMKRRIKRKFYKYPKPIRKQEIYKSSLDDYDGTYSLTNKIISYYYLKLNIQKVRETSTFETMIFWFMMSHVLLATVLETICMINTVSAGTGTLIELFTMMPCVGFLLVAMAKAYKIKRFKHIYQNLTTELRNMWPVGLITEEEHNIIVNSIKHLRLAIGTYFTCNIGLFCIYILPPCFNVIKRLVGFKEGARSLPFFYWFPFDPLQDNVYEAILVLQGFHCFCTVGFMTCGDMLFCIFLSHITTQFSLLGVAINKLIQVKIDNQLIKSYSFGVSSKEHLSNNNRGINNAEVEETLDEKFGKIVNRHRALIRLSEDVENMYTFSLLVNVINSSIIICFSLFCVGFVEKWNEFTYKVFFINGLAQIWFLCWYGQKLQDTSTDIGEALYSSGWYVAQNKIKKSIIIMMHRSQKPMYITTFGFTKVSLESYSTTPILYLDGNAEAGKLFQSFGVRIKKTKQRRYVASVGKSGDSFQIIKTSWSYFTLMMNMYKG